MTKDQVRRLPRHALISHLKRRGIRQRQIADRAGVSQSLVSKAMSREIRGTAAIERIWLELERALADDGPPKTMRRAS